MIKTQSPSSIASHPYVYVLCGHVQGNHQWGSKSNDNNESRECPLCRTVGPLISIIPGLEPSFYAAPATVDYESSTSYAFHPCGHMTSHSTALFWSKMKIPHGRNDHHPALLSIDVCAIAGTKGLKAICPFCSTALSETKPFVRLIFQDSIHRY